MKFEGVGGETIPSLNEVKLRWEDCSDLAVEKE